MKLKNPKIREKLGSRWVGQAPARIFVVEILCFFLFFMLVSQPSKAIVSTWCKSLLQAIYLSRYVL